MDIETYEQIALGREFVGDMVQYLRENMEVQVTFHNDKPVKIAISPFVELKVAKADPGVKGDTVSGTTKPATMETGAVIQVPLFVNQGDVLKVDTRTGTYVTRAGSR